jgi:hypothetical protein
MHDFYTARFAGQQGFVNMLQLSYGLQGDA